MTDLTRRSYEAEFSEAIRLFWAIRNKQAQQQTARGVSDTGTRGAVTGARHLLPMAELIEQVIHDAGIATPATKRTLPGYYRGTKSWDGVVTYRSELVAILELKSQVGSFGKNQNNRIEEMIGQGRDVNMAARRHLLGQLAPWFGYVMIVGDHLDSTSPVKGRQPLAGFPLDPVFATHPSTVERYRIAFQRLRMEGELSAACLVTTARETRNYRFPDKTMSFNAFATVLQNRVIEVVVSLG